VRASAFWQRNPPAPARYARYAMIEQPRRWPFRVGQAAALFAMAVLGMIDMVELTDSPFIALVRVGLALATAALWLPAHRQGSRLLPALAAALAAVSLLVTGLSVIAGFIDTSGGSWGIAEALGMTLVLLVVARRAAGRLAVPVAIALICALAAEPLRSGDKTIFVTFGLLQALLGAGAATIGAYQRYGAEARTQQFVVARAEQRAEFARDLHDFVAHHVTGIVVQAQGARYVAEQDPKRVASALEQIEHAGTEAMTAMRRMVAMLRDPGTDAPLAPLAGVDDLPALVDGFSAASGPPTHLNVHGPLEQLPMDVSTSAYRVVMEALTNVRQHAGGATRVDVLVQRTPDWLLVRVADNGAAPHRLPMHRDRPGFGLAGLTERVQAIGGWLHAGPAAGQGWVVDARLPVREKGTA
jgi:signal transduction histidine kinase